MSRALVIAWMFSTMTVGASAHAQTWQIHEGRVVVVCPLTVGGRFEARSAAVTGQVTIPEGSRELAGAFLVDLRTLTTGISLRDAHLRDNYLEVSRGAGYATAVLDAISLDAPAPAPGRSATLGFRATLTLHGRANPASGTAQVTHRGDRIEVKVSFPLRIDAYEIARPAYLGVGVTNQVEINVRATLKPAATPSS